MEKSNLDSSDEANRSDFQTETVNLLVSENVCESHNLNIESSQTQSSFMHAEHYKYQSRRTEIAIKEHTGLLDKISESTNRLVECLSQDKQILNEKFEQNILALRQKHYVCEKNFKKEIDSEKVKYKELEEKYSTEINSYREQLSRVATELAESKRQSESVKQELENNIASKDRIIHVLDGEKNKLESRIKLLEEEFKNRKNEFEIKIHEYQKNQEDDALKIDHLKNDFNISLKEISQLQSALDETGEKYKVSEENCVKLHEEFNKMKEQLKAEENAKQEKIEAIHSLTVTLNDNKAEIERLRKNFAELAATRQSEVKEFQAQIANKEATYEKSLLETKNHGLQIESKLKEEITQLNERVTRFQSERDSLTSTLEQKSSEFQLSKQQFDRKIKMLDLEKDSLSDKVSRLEEQNKDLLAKLTDTNINYDTSQRELSRVKSYLVNVENERDKRQDELIRVQESYKQLETRLSYTNAELEEFKQFLESEKAINQKRTSEIESLRDSLFSSQSEVDELKSANDKLQRANKEQDEGYRSLLKDRDDLANTLTQIERSRHEINTKFDNSKYSCLSLENKLKLKEDEVSSLSRRIETLNQERKLLFDELESASKSLKQMKQLNEQLHEQTLSLQKRNSSLESKFLEPDRKYTSYSEKEVEIRRAKRESEQLRERLSKLENEKRRIERSYANLERENTALKSTARPTTALPRASSPSLAAQRTQSSDQSSSILSLTRLLSDTNFANSSKLDLFSDEAMKVTRGIEALEQQHMEIQQKVMGLENLLEAASSESEANTTKQSDEFSELKQTHSIKPIDMETLDFNGNYSEVDEKLKVAQMKAQKLIESSTLFEKEFVRPSKMRAYMHQRNTADKSDDELSHDQ